LTIAEKSIEINALPEKIWPMIQWDRTTEWYADWKKVEWTSKDKDKVGSTVHINVEAGRMKTELDYETTEVIENEKVAFRSTGKNFKATGYHGLTPTKDGTKVTIFADYELPYSVFGKLFDKVAFHRTMEKSFDVGLKKLKDMMEK
jgi:carbon monoxide dehydrogenase subunit G